MGQDLPLFARGPGGGIISPYLAAKGEEFNEWQKSGSRAIKAKEREMGNAIYNWGQDVKNSINSLRQNSQTSVPQNLNSKGRKIGQALSNIADSIVNSPEMEYVKMAAPRSQIINARNQLGNAWQNYINATYPETFRGMSNVEPYYETYGLAPRYSEEAKAAAEAYNKAYNEYAPILGDEAKYGRPYSRNYGPKGNMPSHLQNKEVVRVVAPSGTKVGNELIDATQNVAPAVIGQAPGMEFRPTPLFKEGEIKQGADIIREMQKQIKLYREEEKKLQEDREKYNAELIAMVEKNGKNEDWAKKKDQYEYELVQRRNALLDRSLELYNLKEEYNKILADMTKAPELIDYRGVN